MIAALRIAINIINNSILHVIYEWRLSVENVCTNFFFNTEERLQSFEAEKIQLEEHV